MGFQRSTRRAEAHVGNHDGYKIKALANQEQRKNFVGLRGEDFKVLEGRRRAGTEGGRGTKIRII